MEMPRAEYPRPQFVRDEWVCLNGKWEFEIDQGDSGIHRGIMDRKLISEIVVPFCPESPLSGINEQDFMHAVWYRRKIEIPQAWTDKRVLLHFQAVDYDTFVWIDNEFVGRHRGSSSTFHFDITRFITAGKTHDVLVRARDYTKKRNQTAGKQCGDYILWNTFYPRVTGIWQPVWLEPVPQTYLRRPKITPDVATHSFHFAQRISNNTPGMKLKVSMLYGGKLLASAETDVANDFSPAVVLKVPESDVHLWAPGEGNLYDFIMEIIGEDGNVIDKASSYCGLRSISIDGKRVKINGKNVFQRLVLDQGFYPEGVWTAPSDEALENDVKLAMEAGFNGARLHEKIFEERFLYHADRHGYMVWSEYPDCGLDKLNPPVAMLTEYIEIIMRDYNHPSIIGWCGMVEKRLPYKDEIDGLEDVMRGMFYAARSMDCTRPILDDSGGTHRIIESDVWDAHIYEQDSKDLAELTSGMEKDEIFVDNSDLESTGDIYYSGQPFFVSEFGGAWWSDRQKPDKLKSFGWGEPPKTIEEFYERFEALTGVLLGNEYMFGYCYTQLTDVHQEMNGIYYFDRKPKFDNKRIREIQTRTAAIEKLD